jgi:hypothetical protein
MLEAVKKHRYTLVLIAIIVAGTGIMLLNCAKKYGVLFVDEDWSYAYANSRESIRLNNLAYSWMNATVLKNYITVQEDERFSYDIPYNNSSHDAHPPLYSFLLHTICSFFPNTYSKWYGFSINIIFYIGTIIILYLLSDCLFLSKKKAILATLIWAFSLGAISSVLFIRLYMMLTFFTLLSLFFTIKYFIEQKNVYLIYLFISYFLAGMTQYFFWLFAFFLILIFFFLSIKEYKFYLPLGFTALASFLLQCAVFPTTMLQFFNIGFGETGHARLIGENIKLMIDIGEIGRRLTNDFFDRFFPIIIHRDKNFTLLVLFILLTIIFVSISLIKYDIVHKSKTTKIIDVLYWNIKRSISDLFFTHPNKRQNAALAIVTFSLLMCAYFIEVIRPFGDFYAANRFTFNLYPSWSIVITLLGLFIISSIKFLYNKYKNLVILSSLLLIILFINIQGYSLKLFTQNEPLIKIQESLFLKEYSKDQKRFDDFIKDSHLFYMVNNSNFGDIHTLSYTYDLVKEIFMISKNNRNEDSYIKIITNQIKNHIPESEKIILIYEWEDNGNMLVNDSDFISSLYNNGLFIDLLARNIGIYGGFNVYEISYISNNNYMDYKEKNMHIKNEINIIRYLNLINDDHYSIFLTVKDEASNDMNENIHRHLMGLGLKEDIIGKFRYSYLASINKDTIYEQLAEDDSVALNYSGILPNGEKYELFSSGYFSGNRCSIVIEGTEYAVNLRGLNFVIYDNETEEVIDSVAFDTHLRLEAHRK